MFCAVCDWVVRWASYRSWHSRLIILSIVPWKAPLVTVLCHLSVEEQNDCYRQVTPVPTSWLGRFVSCLQKKMNLTYTHTHTHTTILGPSTKPTSENKVQSIFTILTCQGQRSQGHARTLDHAAWRRQESERTCPQEWSNPGWLSLPLLYGWLWGKKRTERNALAHVKITLHKMIAGS